ncbi:hypothetical protein NOL05_04845 [Streptococcus suis]|nr:hypothetical protein [Streptococcus suis]
MTRNKIRTLFVLYYACKQNNTEKKSDRGKEYDFLAIIFGTTKETNGLVK